MRHGYGPERVIQTGIGALEVKRPKVRDRAANAESGEKVRFSSHILPRWARRSRSLDALLPVLYLRGISTGDFQEALAAILGPDAPNLSPGVISRKRPPRPRTAGELVAERGQHLLAERHQRRTGRSGLSRRAAR